MTEKIRFERLVWHITCPDCDLELQRYAHEDGSLEATRQVLREEYEKHRREAHPEE